MQSVKSVLPARIRPLTGSTLFSPLVFSPPVRQTAKATLILTALSLCWGWSALLSSTAFSQEIPPRLEARVRAHIHYLASPEMRGRGGAGKAAARQYIIQELQRVGAKPFFNGDWGQTVPGQTTLAGDTLPDGENIGGCVYGTDPLLKNEWIIVNAHYDHLGVRNGRIYAGADDNASGVSMLLELARQIAAHPLKRSVAFVAFDFEESLLWGSRWFIGHTPVDVEQIKFCMTADMIGRSLGGLGLPTVFVLGAEHSTVARQAIGQASIPAGLEVAQLGVDIIGTRSDYGPFRDQGIPFLFFSTGEHPDYHTPGDVPERIDIEKASRIIRFAGDLLTAIGNTERPLEWEPPVYQKIEEAQAVNRITQLLLEADREGSIQLSSSQRFFVSQVQSKTAFMVRRERVSDDERKWLARAALILLVSVF